jgi:SAM-dependent methyltransferase
VVSRRAAEVAAELAPSLDDPQALALVPPEEADLTALPLDPATLDLVASFSVLHGVARWDHALDEVGRVLRAGGHLLLGMPGGALAPTPACSPAAAATRFHRSGLRTVATAHLDLPLRPPLGVRLYHVWLVEKI